MTGNRPVDPSVSGRGRCFLAARDQIVKYMLTSHRMREGTESRTESGTTRRVRVPWFPNPFRQSANCKPAPFPYSLLTYPTKSIPQRFSLREMAATLATMSP